MLKIFLAGLFLKIAYNWKLTAFEDEDLFGVLVSTLLTASLSSSKIEISLFGNIGIEFLIKNASLFTTTVCLQ